MQPHADALTKADMEINIRRWLEAWNRHDLNGVMELMHEQVLFDNWTGETIQSKQALYRAWTPWFVRHGDFNFTLEDIFIDELAQKAVFEWCLQWPSLEVAYKSKPEVRQGIDVLHFSGGKIIKKSSFSKTTLTIAGAPVVLQAAL